MPLGNACKELKDALYSIKYAEGKKMTEKLQTRRTLNLSIKTATDLKNLCDYLGVKHHAYIENELAKCIQRDLITYMSKNVMDEMSDFIKNSKES